jgi:uncharacterized membrane protein YcaP (DUF421 family)
LAGTAVKTLLMFLAAAVAFRFSQRRTIAEFTPFDWITAVAVGAIIGRTATSANTSWAVGATAMLTLLIAHGALSRLRFRPALQRLIDPPPRILIRDGRIDFISLKRCGLTDADLAAALRQHGLHDASTVHLAIYEAKGAISILTDKPSRPIESEPPR